MVKTAMASIKSIISYPATFTHTTMYVALQALLSCLSIPRLLHQHVFHDGAAAERKYNVDGAFALVTGATDGIGKALVEELARRGWNIILHGRSSTKVQPLIESLLSSYQNQRFFPLIADASRSPEQLDLAGQLESLKEGGCVITLLINNAGCLPPVKPFAQLSDVEIVENVHVNVSFGVCLTRVLLAGEFLGEKSCILNIGSIGSVMILPGTPTYSASKSFTSKFSACLQKQLAPINPTLEILSVTPGGVSTKMTPIESAAYSSLDGRAFLVTPSAFAKAVLGKMGLGNGYREVYPCWRHELQMGILTAFPEEGGSRAWVNAILMRGVVGPRAEGWKKLGAGWRMVDGRMVEPGVLVDVE